MRGEFNRSKAEEAAKEIFQCADENADGVLTEEEFIAGAKRCPGIIKVLTGQ